MTQISNDRVLSKIPTSPLGLFFALSVGSYVPHELWDRANFRKKFCFRAIVMPVLTYRLLKMLTENPYYETLLYTQPRIPCRIHRPYLSTRMSRRENVDALALHYEKMTAFLSKDNFLAHLSPSGLKLAYLKGKDGSIYRLCFKSTHKLDREGEVSVILADSHGNMLSKMTFTLCQRFDEDCLIIGGLQGPNTADALDSIQHATKQLYGLFPKRILIDAVLFLGHLMNVRRVYAVSNMNHVYQALRYSNRKKQIFANYDDLWEVSGGIRTPDNYYQLPPVIKRKKIEDVPSKKRSEYRKRFELLDELNQEIYQSLMKSPEFFCNPAP